MDRRVKLSKRFVKQSSRDILHSYCTLFPFLYRNETIQ